MADVDGDVDNEQVSTHPLAVIVNDIADDIH